ncbi:Malate dehydrogenase, cytoplasmic [Saguinus oedipus]|uniref:Malate dehydrogenase, cytoplasmic n=1 Tax=Saguinus oedipus TaxID=9490 RepID=A0ABQ9VUC9_SAGOE|nr:Malate dehydrogenase, cytoplasmic [Saguinus oedipus]
MPGYGHSLGLCAKKERCRAKRLTENVKIFKRPGAALEKYDKKFVKVIVMGNPANTNCLTASNLAPSIFKENFSCLPCLNHNQTKTQITLKRGLTADNVKNIVIWGNHFLTQYPGINQAKVVVFEALTDDSRPQGEFTTVQQHGAAVTEARKSSRAMPTARAISNHIRGVWLGTP